MRVLVTGGNGFIGQHTCEMLEMAGHEAVVADYHYPYDTNTAPRRQTFLADVRDEALIDTVVSMCDTVINLAGVLGTQETVKNPCPSVQTNIVGALNVFEACRRHNKPCAQITVGNHWMNNSYSITKSTAERFALMYNRELGTRIAVVRVLNAYGPRQKEYPVRKIIPSFVCRALRGETIQVYGDGQQVMDMVWVGDVARALIAAATKDHGCYGSIFSVGTGRRTTVRQIAELVAKELGAKIEELPMRPGEPEHAVVLGDPETLGPLGIAPSSLKPLEEGLPTTIKWYASYREETR